MPTLVFMFKEITEALVFVLIIYFMKILIILVFKKYKILKEYHANNINEFTPQFAQKLQILRNLNNIESNKKIVFDIHIQDLEDGESLPFTFDLADDQFISYNAGYDKDSIIDFISGNLNLQTQDGNNKIKYTIKC
mgnify:CR=1 FL=1